MTILRYVREWISHLTIIFSLMIVTFWVTDRFNSAMAFINHPLTKGLMFVFALCGIALSIGLILNRLSFARWAQCGVGIFNLILSAGLVLLVGIDYFQPARLLFVSDIVKFYLLATVICGMISSILGICCRRKSYWIALQERKDEEQ